MSFQSGKISTLLCLLILGLMTLSFAPFLQAQQPANAPAAPGPRLVNFSGRATNPSSQAISGAVGVTFAIYKDQYDGAPLWLETQSLIADARGNFTAALGATQPEGLPLTLFSTSEARWLGVRINSGDEQPRVLLMSVPYALKAADAETIGGLPPSAFLLAAPVANAPASAAVNPADTTAALSASPASSTPASSDVTTTGGTVSAIPLFSTATNIQNSALSQGGTGATTKVTLKGALAFPATGGATAAAGKPSYPVNFTTSAYSGSTHTAVGQTFQLKSEPAGNDTAGASATLNVLFGEGTVAPAETGLKISNKGLLTFASGQTFPGTGSVTSVALTAPASDFTIAGSPITKSGTLALKWNVAPTDAATASAIVKRDASGSFSAAKITAADVTLTDELYMTSNEVYPATIAGGNSSGVTFSAGTPGGWGILGSTEGQDDDSYGVVGYADVFTGSGMGVYGGAYSPDGVGVFGQNGGESGTGQTLDSYLSEAGAGVWGDGGYQNPGGMGVVGSVDDGTSGVFLNFSDNYYTLYVENAAPGGYPFAAFNGITNDYCNINPTGDLSCTGSKNAVVPVDGGKRTVALSAIESPQNWFEDFGSAELSHGSAVIPLDSVFTQTVNTEQEYQVFLTPYGDCKGLYVTNRSANAFEVHELGGGTASLSFGYRVTALRRKYESVRFADHSHDLDGLKNMHKRPKRTSGAPQHHDPRQKLAAVRAAHALK
jgi:hypothetical protein